MVDRFSYYWQKSAVIFFYIFLIMQNFIYEMLKSVFHKLFNKIMVLFLFYIQ